MGCRKHVNPTQSGPHQPLKTTASEICEYDCLVTSYLFY